MKAPSPLLGFNNNVRHKGRVFHIQTEDSGVKHPHVITHLFADGGRIVKSTKTSYAEYLGDEEMARKVRALMQEQHKAMFIALRAGKFDHLMEGIPLAEPPPGAGPRPPMESTVSIEVEGDKVPGATPSQSGAQGPASKDTGKAAAPEVPTSAAAAASRPSNAPPASAPAASAPAASAPAASAPAASAPAASAPAASAPAASASAAAVAAVAPQAPPPSAQPTGGRAPMAALIDTVESSPTSEVAPAAPARAPSIPPPSGRNPMPSQGLRHLTPPPKAPSMPPPSALRGAVVGAPKPASLPQTAASPQTASPQTASPLAAPQQTARASIPPPVQARPSVPPPLSTGPSGPATISGSLSRAPEKRPLTPPPPTPARDALAGRSDPRAEPDAAPVPSSGRSPIGGARPQATPPPPPGSKPRHDPRAEEPAPVRRSGSLLATLGSGVPNPPKPLSLGASPTPARAANPAPTTLTASLSAGLKPRGDAVRELGTAPTQAMPAARAPSKTGSGPAAPTGGNSPSRPPMSSSLDLDLEALERAAEQGHSPVYRQVRDLPPPPAAVMRSTGANPATYRSLTPPGAQQSPQSVPAGAMGPASQQGRYAPSRPASIFGNARPQEGSSIFGEDLISEKSLDEVILSYLAEDLDAPPKK